MNYAKITTNTGFEWITSINGTLDEVKKYFIGKYFNCGQYPKEDMQKVVSVKLFNKNGKEIINNLGETLQQANKRVDFYTSADFTSRFYYEQSFKEARKKGTLLANKNGKNWQISDGLGVAAFIYLALGENNETAKKIIQECINKKSVAPAEYLHLRQDKKITKHFLLGLKMGLKIGA